MEPGVRRISGNVFGDNAMIFQGDVTQGHFFPQNFKLDRRQCLADLRVNEPRDDKELLESSVGDSLISSHRWIQDHPDFLRWRDQPGGLLWIEGGPGTGKTMLIIGLIDELENQRPETGLLAFFFLRSGDTRLNNDISVLRSLMYQLVQQAPSLISHLMEEYRYSGRSLFENDNAFPLLSRIFQDMLHDPLVTAAYLIVDGLDECAIGRERLLDLIVESSNDSRNRVKWLLSSRPHDDIKYHLQKSNACLRIKLEENPQQLSRNVDEYILHQVSELAKRRRLSREVYSEILDRLRKESNNTFLWVKLMVQSLERSKSLVSLRKALSATPYGLTALYDQELDRILQSDDAELCCQILAVVALAYRPLTLEELGVLVGTQGANDMYGLVSLVDQCGPFVSIKDKEISLFHVSAARYLRKSSAIYPDDTRDHHFRMFSTSLSALSRVLRKDICNLHDPGSVSPMIEPEADHPLSGMPYSCSFWADHLFDANWKKIDSGDVLSETGRVYIFLKEHFLHWLESLSLMGSVTKGRSVISMILQHLAHDLCLNFSRFLRDAERFVLSYGSLIRQFPLQTYGSALVFSPAKSEVKHFFWKERYKLVDSVKNINEDWSPCVQVLEGHTGSVWAVTFSPDGQQIASASNDRTIRMWDSFTGQCQNVIRGHTETVRAVSFSPNSAGIASASYDETVRTWAAVSGGAAQVLRGHTKWANSVSFSSDDLKLASASNDRTIRLWEISTGQCLMTITGHEDSVTCVEFSPDGMTLASASYDRSVRLWNAETGECRQTLRGCDAIVNSVSISPDGKHIASASDDGKIRIWDITTGDCQAVLEGHSQWVSSVAFSPDGRILASASNDGTVKLWNLQTRTSIQTFRGHSSSVSSTSFSPDGQQLVSGSIDKTIRLWDASVDSKHQSEDGSPVRLLVISSDGQRLASVLGNNVLQIWHPHTGTLRTRLDGIAGMITSLAFSPDSRRISAASKGKELRIWDADTGECTTTFEDSSETVQAMAFSNDTSQIALVSNDGTICLWDIQTGALRRSIETGMPISKLSYTTDDRYLQTDKGTLPLSIDHPILLRTPIKSTSRFVVRGDWIVRDEQKVLWLPRDYRPSCWASYHDLLVLGLASGRVMFLNFDSDLWLVGSLCD